MDVLVIMNTETSLLKRVPFEKENKIIQMFSQMSQKNICVFILVFILKYSIYYDKIIKEELYIYIVNKKTKLISVALERIHYVKATTIVMYIDVDIR